MRSVFFSSAAFGLAAIVAVPALAQAPDGIALTGLDGHATTVSADDLAALPRVTVEVEQHGTRHRYEGASLTDVLAKVGAPSGKALHGADLADAVVVRARDNYTVVFALAETDAATRRDRIILADRIDGAPLGEKQGPFQIVVEGDLRPARSARMVTAITLRRVE